MWLVITNHEEAYEYYREGLLWYGQPEKGDDHVWSYATEDGQLCWDRGSFIQQCAGIGILGDDGFMYPNYIYIEA